MLGNIISLNNIGLSHNRFGYDSKLLTKTQSSRNNIYCPNSLLSTQTLYSLFLTLLSSSKIYINIILVNLPYNHPFIEEHSLLNKMRT